MQGIGVYLPGLRLAKSFNARLNGVETALQALQALQALEIC